MMSKHALTPPTPAACFVLAASTLFVAACTSDPAPAPATTDGSPAAEDAALPMGDDASVDASTDAPATATDAQVAPAVDEPKGWKDALQVPVAEDINPAPDIVEIELEASEQTWRYGPDGAETQVYAFNGSIPGPRIEGKVGDTLIVHFTNNLPEETTVHWHGLELPAVQDGSLISQLPVQPGESQTYTFELLSASTYWYHPHRESHVQIEKGLYGPLVVRDPAQDEALGMPDEELMLVMDDVLLDRDGQVAPPFPEGDALKLAELSLNGRQGDLVLINGQPLPSEAIQVRSGVPVRMRVVNSANSRFFRLTMDDANFILVGVDGGLLEAPQPVLPIGMIPHAQAEMALNLPLSGSTVPVSDPDPSLGVLLTPGQRADLVFTPVGEVGTKFVLRNHDIHRGRHEVTFGGDGIQLIHTTADGESPPMDLLTFEIVEGGDPQAAPYEPPAKLREIERIDVTNAEKLMVMFGHTMPTLDGEVSMFATMKDGMGVPFDQLSAEDALQAKVGETYIYEVVNMTGGDHPFHPHGFFFQPLELEYVDEEHPERNHVVPFERLEQRDTIRVPARLGNMGKSRTIARLAVRFDDRGREGEVTAFGKTPTETTSGGWLVHCHILEHAKLGMMTFVNLRE